MISLLGPERTKAASTIRRPWPSSSPWREPAFAPVRSVLSIRLGISLSGMEYFGAGDRHRTRNLRFTKPLLYQLSYTGPNANASLFGSFV